MVMLAPLRRLTLATRCDGGWPDQQRRCPAVFRRPAPIPSVLSMSHNSASGKRSTHSVRRNGLKVLAGALAVTGITALAAMDVASATSAGSPPIRGQLVSAAPLRTLLT